MKYAVFFVLFCIAMAAAAPQYLTAWPGWTGVPGVVPARTVVAGPTVVHSPWGGYVNPGYVGPAIF